ncbi:uncharacterized protein V1518DRAFT_409026 [Limtongia smithiae]|uniref:uncharacterized protein n=1 Tax=Limtongia smithiae TaxID=1125753 RepID=UPI0034CF9C93
MATATIVTSRSAGVPTGPSASNSGSAATAPTNVHLASFVLSTPAVDSVKSKRMHFTFEAFLRKEYQFGIDPSRPICKKYLQDACELGNACEDRHVHPSAPNRVVCKHWLRGLCKKGDACEFLHEYNLRKMPECTFFARNKFCTQSPDCLYLHIDPQSRIPVCPNYERGFCRLGPGCQKRHIRKTLCEFYLAGFCPKGSACDKVHPKWTFNENMRIRAAGEKPVYHDASMDTDDFAQKDTEDVIKVLR